MTSIETIANEGTLALVSHFAKKEGYEDEQISMFSEVLDTIKTIMEEKVRPYSQEWENEGAKLVDGKVTVPKGLEDVMIELIKDNELYSWFMPEEFGGYGFSGVFQSASNELMCQYDMSLQILTTISLSVMEPLIIYNKPEYEPIIKQFMNGERTGYVAFTEAQAGSNLQNVKATSELDGDEYVLNGSKIFISNGGYANTGLFLARNMVDGKEEGTNVFLVDNLDGITTVRLEEKSGIHADPTAELLYENVRVPKEYLIANPGEGYRKVLERLMGMRLGVTFQGIGATKRAYELSKAYAAERVQFGKPIDSFPGVSRKLEEMRKQIPKLEAYGYLAAYSLDRYYKNYIPADIGATGPSSEKTAADMFPSAVRVGLAHYFVSSAKLYTSEIANSILYDAQQIFGGNGFVSEYEVNKICRDVRVLPVYEGTSEIHEYLIGRAQQALNLLPKFKPLSESFEGLTMYERILYERFPQIVGKM
ncbi:MAG: acyl-CoA dehydrogenase family protein [Candidatus Kariarchaeaceae archaeon]|jgi:alkylation response protein AidB-like acyl-CoA dehydrogenase